MYLGILDYTIEYLENSRKKLRKLSFEDFIDVEIVDENDSEFWVVFLPWRYKCDKAREFYLVPKNKNYISISNPNTIVGTTPMTSITSMSKSVERAEQILKFLGIRPNSTSVLSISVGNMPGFYFANNYGCNRLVSLTPGARLGENIFQGIFTKHIKEYAIESGYKTHEKYGQVMEGLNPIDNIENLPIGRINIEFGSLDRVILSNSARELISKLRHKNPIVLEHKFRGHTETVLNWTQRNKKGELEYFNSV